MAMSKHCTISSPHSALSRSASPLARRPKQVSTPASPPPPHKRQFGSPLRSDRGPECSFTLKERPHEIHSSDNKDDTSLYPDTRFAPGRDRSGLAGRGTGGNR